ncbi:MAG: response regulator transcription factor [Methylobacter sp.]|nr:response regulator transcription factor [Methylobacter sp.]MDP2427984.1 response regulator transcription factor [Methylobacter sp.]MDP3055829.1 response regulator transcription factor [Methylobacter sp.]MDP3363492.1 response regulator transcription factor [Methylobacter sp.]MDZ4218890.1 response regulator transcription factor [Methylobacter sp.]
MTINVIIADGHPLILFAVDKLLSSETDFTVQERCTSGDAALLAVQQYQPDVLIVNADLPGKTGLSVLRELHEAKSCTRVVFLVAAMDGETLLEAVRCQVRGVVLMGMALQLLVPCIRKVYAGGEWLERDSVRSALDQVLQNGAQAAQTTESLSLKELELARMVADGDSNKIIARKLDSTEGAVKANLHRIYQKFDARNRVDLARMVREKGL